MKVNMPLKNYQSRSPLPNIFSAIEKTLASHGARQIVRDYDGGGRIVSISFSVQVNDQILGIKLPAKIDQVERIFQEQGVKYKPEQPYRTAWATIRDWIDAQMALIDWEVVRLEEVFLPYMVWQDGRTFFQVMEDKNFLIGEGKHE